MPPRAYTTLIDNHPQQIKRAGRLPEIPGRPWQ
jgi:hypothetical protein